MKKLKKSLSLLLALVMVLSCMSVGAMAEGTTEQKTGSVASANVNGVTKYYTSLMEAIDAAYNGGTVELLQDVTVNRWHQNVWATEDRDDLTYSGDRALTGCNGLTIDGKNHTLTVNSVDSNGNGNQLLKGSKNLTVKNLTINAASGVNGIGLKSGLIENVTFNMTGDNPAIYTLGSTGNTEGEHIEIRNCTFNNPMNGTLFPVIYTRDEGDDVDTIIAGNTFNTNRSVVLHNNMQFLNNKVNSNKGVSVGPNATAVVRGNYFAENTERSISAYPAQATYEYNVILSDIDLNNNATPNLSGNYWGGGEPENLPNGVTCNSYYKDASNLPTDGDVGAHFTLSNPVNVGGETETTFVGNTDEAIRTQLGNSDAIIVTPDTTAADYDPDKTYVAYKDSDENLVKATLDVNIVEATTGIESTLDASDVQVTALNNAAANAGEQIEKSQINIAKYAKDFNVSSGTLDFGYSMTLKTSATNSVKFDIKPTVKVGNAAAVELGSDYVNQSTGMTVLMPIPNSWTAVKVYHYADGDATGELVNGVTVVTINGVKYAKFQAMSFSDYEGVKAADYVGYVKTLGANVGNTIYLNVRMMFTNPQSGMKLKYEVGGNAAKYYALPTAASDGSYQFQIPVIAKYFGVKGTISIVNSDDTETYYISKGEAGEHVTSVQYSVYDYLDLLETSNVASSWLELSTAIRNLGNASARHWGDTYNQSMQDVSWIAYPAN